MSKKGNTAARKPALVVDPHPGKHWVLFMDEKFHKHMKLVDK